MRPPRCYGTGGWREPGRGAGWGQSQLVWARRSSRDDGGVLCERWEVECAERVEARNVVVRVAFVDDDPHDLEAIFGAVGNDECILREETEVGVGAPFVGVQLDTQRFNIERGKELRDTHAMRLALFPTHQEEHIHAPVQHIRDKKSEVFPYNLDQNVDIVQNHTF